MIGFIAVLDNGKKVPVFYAFVYRRDKRADTQLCVALCCAAGI